MAKVDDFDAQQQARLRLTEEEMRQRNKLTGNELHDAVRWLLRDVMNNSGLKRAAEAEVLLRRIGGQK